MFCVHMTVLMLVANQNLAIFPRSALQTDITMAKVYKKKKKILPKV